MTLLDYFEAWPEIWLSAHIVASKQNVNRRKLRDRINALNQELSESGSIYIVCSSTKKDESGYRYTKDPEITERCMAQLRNHAVSELKKLKNAAIALKRQREWQLRQQPEPIVEPNNQIRMRL